MYKISYSTKAVKELKKIPKKWQIKIIRTIESLQENPTRGKKLQGELFGLYSLKAWPYRIIYTINKQEVLIQIVDIGHRQNIYK